jgi:hypothetical protein
MRELKKIYLISSHKITIRWNWKELMSGGSKKSECIKKNLIKTTPLPPNITLSDEQSEVWDWPLLLSELTNYAPLMINRQIDFMCILRCVCLSNYNGRFRTDINDKCEIFCKQEEVEHESSSICCIVQNMLQQVRSLFCFLSPIILCCLSNNVRTN